MEIIADICLYRLFAFISEHYPDANQLVHESEDCGGNPTVDSMVWQGADGQALISWAYLGYTRACPEVIEKMKEVGLLPV